MLKKILLLTLLLLNIGYTKDNIVVYYIHDVKNGEIYLV